MELSLVEVDKSVLSLDDSRLAESGSVEFHIKLTPHLPFYDHPQLVNSEAFHRPVPASRGQFQAKNGADRGGIQQSSGQLKVTP